MDTRKFAFILCANNNQYYEECMLYLEELDIPDGYETEVVCIQEAMSMAAGYNAGMKHCDAKYKIYLHQDTFLLNQNFLHDILLIFNTDSKIGMIGVIGVSGIPQDGEYWRSWSEGSVFGYTGIGTMSMVLRQSADVQYRPVNAIDGMIMITQYDVPWREDILDGWDFYDVSQSVEMKRRGYEVVVPYQSLAWCHHDCGPSKMKSYDFYKQRMYKEYPDFFTGRWDFEASKIRQEMATLMDDLRNQLTWMMEEGMYQQLSKITESLGDESNFDTSIREIEVLMSIYFQEKKSGTGFHSKWFRMRKWSEIAESYREVRLILLRMSYGKQDERIAKLQDQVRKGEVTREAIHILAAYNTREPDKLVKLLLG